MDNEVDLREQRGRALAKAKSSKIRQVVEGRYLVPSQSRTTGSYFVDIETGVCSCPDHEAHGHRCKHLWAVIVFRTEVTTAEGETVVIEQRKTYKQQWPEYRAGRMNEKDLYEKLLASLCRGIPQPAYKGNGRPALPLSDVIFAGGLKVYSLFSGDRAMSDIRAAKERGHIDVVPHPNTIFRVMRSPETVPVLRRLIEQSALPLRACEENFALDATGIATKGYVRWFDKKWGKDRREKRWLKLHMMIGVKTQIITAAEVTEGNANDSPYLPPLVEATAKNFKMRRVPGDKGYLSHENFNAITKVGAEPFIPFKINSRGDTKDDLWNRLHALYTLNHEEWASHYHTRSLTESHFSSIKRVLGASVKAKSFDGQVAEVYLKVLAANLRVLVNSMFELNIRPTFWNDTALQETA